MTKTIYVVRGSTGEYSDRTEWNVKAFEREDAARELVLKAEEKSRELYVKYGFEYFDYDSEKDPNPFDPSFRLDYTGTSYYYESVELETYDPNADCDGE